MGLIQFINLVLRS